MVQQKISSFLRGRGLVFPYQPPHQHNGQDNSGASEASSSEHPVAKKRIMEQSTLHFVDRKEKWPKPKKYVKPRDPTQPRMVLYTHDKSCPGPSHAKVFYIPRFFFRGCKAVIEDPEEAKKVDDLLRKAQAEGRV